MSVRLAGAPVEIPAGVDRMRVVAHARRVAHLTRAWGVAAAGMQSRDLEVYGAVMPIGIALSWAVDLGAIPIESGQLTFADVRAAAFPGRPEALVFRAAVAADAPRYEPPVSLEQTPRGCPGSGRHQGHRRVVKWVGDIETGAWEWREVCGAHVDIARQRSHQSPDPAPNRGGVLAAVFPEINLDVVYAWARSGWTPAGDPVQAVIGARAFRLIINDQQ